MALSAHDGCPRGAYRQGTRCGGCRRLLRPLSLRSCSLRRPALLRRSAVRPAPRASRVEPALATLPNSASEWQFQAAREDTVPEWVQRAAQGITIAVIDTGADLTAPDLAAKQPGAYDVRSQTTD